MSVYRMASSRMCEYTPINAPITIVGMVAFWLSFSGDVMVRIGFLSMSNRTVSGSASNIVPPMNVCKGGPCRSPGRLKNTIIKGCMSGAMLPNSNAGKYA